MRSNPVEESPAGLVQRLENSDPGGTPPAAGPAGEGSPPEGAAGLTPQQVADRVYELLMRDLRQERERRGW